MPTLLFLASSFCTKSIILSVLTFDEVLEHTPELSINKCRQVENRLLSAKTADFKKEIFAAVATNDQTKCLNYHGRRLLLNGYVMRKTV